MCGYKIKFSKKFRQGAFQVFFIQKNRGAQSFFDKKMITVNEIFCQRKNDLRKKSSTHRKMNEFRKRSSSVFVRL